MLPTGGGKRGAVESWAFIGRVRVTTILQNGLNENKFQQGVKAEVKKQRQKFVLELKSLRKKDFLRTIPSRDGTSSQS